MAPDIGFRDRLPSMDASIVAVFETQACADDPLLSAGSILSSATRRTQIARLTGRRPATLEIAFCQVRPAESERQVRLLCLSGGFAKGPGVGSSRRQRAGKDVRAPDVDGAVYVCLAGGEVGGQAGA